MSRNRCPVPDGGQVETGNVLVLAPAMSDAKTETCYDCLRAVPPSEMGLLRVVYHRSPEQLLEEWEQQVGDRPARTVILSVDDRSHSGPMQRENGTVDHQRVDVLTANPNDLTGLGMELNTALTELSRTGTDIHVCFDSVSALLQFVETEDAYKFLHMFTGQLHDAGAAAHFHIDPEAHDTQTLSRVKTTFDDLVDLT